MGCHYFDKPTGRCMKPQWNSADKLPKQSGTYLVWISDEKNPANKGAFTGCRYSLGQGWLDLPDNLKKNITHWKFQTRPIIRNKDNGNGKSS